MANKENYKLEDENPMDLDHALVSNEEAEELRLRGRFIKREVIDGTTMEFWITEHGQLLVTPASKQSPPPLRDWAITIVILAAAGFLLWEGARWLGWL